MKKLLFLIFYIVFIGLLFTSPKLVNAEILLQDDFNTASISGQWESVPGPDGYWKIDNGEVEGSVVKKYNHLDTFSSLLAGNINWSNYSITAKLKGVLGKDKKIMVRYLNEGTRYDISLISGSGVYLQKWLNGIDKGYVSEIFNNSNSVWYKVKVEAIDNTFKVFVNDELKITYIDNNTDPMNLPILKGKIGLQVWPGWHTIGLGDVTTVRYDDVLVCDFEGPCEMPTTTPTPTPIIDPNIEKIVFLPGMTASWNADALLNCKTEGYDGTWTMGSYANPFYEPFYKAFGTQIIPYYYDWRKDVRSHATDLKNFIDGLDENKVNLVGHSMGGLVSRAYLEQTKELSKIDRLMTLGSPHRGTVQAYSTWSAGEIAEDNLILKFIETLLLKRCGTNSKNSREIIRQVLPSSQNLLPTFNYLKDHKSGEIKAVESMNVKSNLPLTSIDPNFWGIKFGTLSGKGFPTPLYLLTKNPSNHDLLLGNWFDGKVLKNENSDEGDGTVLLLSSKIPGATNLEVNQNHTGLVNSQEAITQIKSFLDITTNNLSLISLSPPELTSALVVMSYPSSFMVSDQNNNRQNDKDGLVFIPNPRKGKYQFEVLPKSEDSLFIVAQFLDNGQIYWKEYNLKNKLLKKGAIDFDPLQSSEDIVKFQP